MGSRKGKGNARWRLGGMLTSSVSVRNAKFWKDRIIEKLGSRKTGF